MHFLDLLDKYTKFHILRPATISSYRDAIRNLERFFLAQLRPLPSIPSLTEDDLLEHRAWALDHMAATSYNKHRRHLRALLNFAVREQTLARSPMAKVIAAPTGLRRPKVLPTTWYKQACKVLDCDQLAGLNPPVFWRLAFTVIHFTGMRRRQLVELRWGDVLWSKAALLLRSEGSKSRREWLVPLPKWVMGELHTLARLIGTYLGRPVQSTDQVFALPIIRPRHTSQARHTRMTEAHLSRGFEALSRHLGYPISAHRVRHTSATVMLSGRGDLKSVSDMLGHTDIKLTASIYVHPHVGRLRRIQGVLSGYSQEMAQA